MRFFHILRYISRSDADLSILKIFYDDFVTTLFEESENANDLTALYNQLSLAQVELLDLRKDKQIKQINKHIPIRTSYHKALKLVNQQMKFVELKVTQTPRELKPQKRLIGKQIKWTGSIAEFVEIVYATFSTNSFNNGEVTIKELMLYFGNVFDFDPNDYYHKYNDIKKRKKDPTTFLTKLRKALIKKMEESENK